MFRGGGDLWPIEEEYSSSVVAVGSTRAKEGSEKEGGRVRRRGGECEV